MHELSITENLLKHCLSEAEKQNAIKIKRSKYAWDSFEA